MENGIKRREIVMCIIFSIITFGIYELYWMAKLNDDTNTIAGESNGKSGVMVVVLTIVTCGIYGIYWAYQCGVKIDSVKSARGQAAGNLGVLYAIVFLFINIVTLALMQNEINNLNTNAAA